LSALVVIPEIGLGDLGLEFRNPFAFAINVKDTSSALRA